MTRGKATCWLCGLSADWVYDAVRDVSTGVKTYSCYQCDNCGEGTYCRRMSSSDQEHDARNASDVGGQADEETGTTALKGGDQSDFDSDT